jgi:hypothetical protein
MSPEDIEKTMQFLLQQQAQFAADAARIETGLDRLMVHGEEVDRKIDRLTDAMLGLTALFNRHLRDDHGYRSS